MTVKLLFLAGALLALLLLVLGIVGAYAVLASRKTVED